MKGAPFDKTIWTAWFQRVWAWTSIWNRHYQYKKKFAVAKFI